MQKEEVQILFEYKMKGRSDAAFFYYPFLSYI